MTLYEGDSMAETMIDEYCGQSIPPRYITSSNKVFLKLKTDKYHTSNKGFKMEYQPYSKLKLVKSVFKATFSVAAAF